MYESQSHGICFPVQSSSRSFRELGVKIINRLLDEREIKYKKIKKEVEEPIDINIKFNG